jgi:hypothetical protein
MTASRDPDRLIHAFLHEGLDELPDPVYDAVRDRIEQTRQRAFIGPWRISDMNRYLKLGLVAAAVLVVAVVGYNVLPGSDGPGGEPSATPEPTLEPTPAPSAAAGLPVGSTYVLRYEVPLLPIIQVTIPAPGWSDDGGILVATSHSATDGAYVIAGWMGDPLIPADPCGWESTMPDTPATTLDEIVAALGGQATRNASAPLDVTVDGHAGKSITMEMPADMPYSAGNNPDCDQNKFCTLSFEDGTTCYMWHQEAGQIEQLWIVDLDGEFIFVTGAYWSETPPDRIEEVQAILGSMTFPQ